MAYSAWLYDIIRDEFAHDADVTVDTIDGWETRGRDAAHAGVMDHHTGSKADTRYGSLLRYLIDGYPYPPAYNIATAAPHIAPDVDRHVVTVVAAGKANHAGTGDLSWLDRDDGNRRTIGVGHFSTVEQHPWGDRYLQIQRRLDACLLEHMGQSYLRRADHKEYAPDRKRDRHSIDTARWDRDLRDLMAARAQGGTDMPTTDEIVRAVLDAPVPHLDPVHGGDNATVTVRDALARTLVNATQARRATARLTGDVDALRTIVREAVNDAGITADADAIVDALVARLAN